MFYAIFNNTVAMSVALLSEREGSCQLEGSLGANRSDTH